MLIGNKLVPVPCHEVGGYFVQRSNVLFGRRRLQHHLLDLSAEGVPLFTVPVGENKIR